jgi:hypothetical protein
MGPGERGRVSDFGQALQALIEALGRSAIPYMIGGSMASGIHGIYRTSLDVDLVADIHPGQIARLIQELGGEFYADAGMMRDALESGRSFNLIHFASSYKFDIFPLSSDPFQQSQFSRREIERHRTRRRDAHRARGHRRRYSAHEAGLVPRRGEVSERQWNDVRGIVAVQRQRLDREYLRRWAAYLKVADWVDAALTAA